MNEGRGKKIVITGAGGFLGSNLVNALAGESEFFVYALSSRANSLQQANMNGNIQFSDWNAVFSDEGAHILENSIVVNCAFPRNTDGFELADGMKYIQRLFTRSVECKVKAIINISSQSVYSKNREEPATEDTQICLESTYAVGKYATELMLEMACRNSSIYYTNLRMASLIGAGFNQRIVNKLIFKALNGEPITVVQSKKTYGFLDVHDAVDAIISVIMLSPENWDSIYNVGNSKSYTLLDIYKEIKLVLSNHDIPMPETYFEFEDNRESSAVSGEKLYMDTGFRAKILIEESIERILDSLT